MSKQTILHSDPEIMSGEPVFVGTRVPVKALFDYTEAGDTLESFLEDYPGVSREQALAALQLAHAALVTDARTA